MRYLVLALLTTLGLHALPTTAPVNRTLPRIWVVTCARKEGTRCVERAPLVPGTKLKATPGSWLP